MQSKIKCWQSAECFISARIQINIETFSQFPINLHNYFTPFQYKGILYIKGWREFNHFWIGAHIQCCILNTHLVRPWCGFGLWSCCKNSDIFSTPRHLLKLKQQSSLQVDIESNTYAVILKHEMVSRPARAKIAEIFPMVYQTAVNTGRWRTQNIAHLFKKVCQGKMQQMHVIRFSLMVR